MAYIAVMKWAVDGAVEKFQPFTLQADADAHVVAHAAAYPDAFVCVEPSGSSIDWVVSAPGVVTNDTARLVAVAKTIRKSEIDALCATTCAACTHLTYTWQADMNSVGAIVAKHHVLEGTPPVNTTWTDAGNTTRTLLWADFVSLKTRIFDFYEAAFANKQTHRAAVDLLSDVATIEAYNITTGWPV